MILQQRFSPSALLALKFGKKVSKNLGAIHCYAGHKQFSLLTEWLGSLEP